MSSRCQSRQHVYQAACHLGAGTSSGAKRLRGVGGVVWVVVARSEGRRGAATRRAWACGEDRIGRNGYFVVQGEGRGKMGRTSLGPFSAQGRSANK